MEEQPISHLPIQGGGSNPINTLANQELAKIVSFSLEVSSSSVPVNSSVTVTWNVKLPTVTGFTFVVLLNGTKVNASGSQIFIVNSQKVFTLGASVTIDPSDVRTLVTRIVEVNTSDCQTETLPSALITIPLQGQLQQAFSSSSQITLNPAITVTAATGVINISAPLKINVPDWFDASMTVTIQIAISGTSSVQVTVPTLNVDVDWGLASNLLSFGCTSLVGSGMSKISQILFQHIVNAEVVAAIQSGLNSAVASFITSAEQQDAQHRPFALHSLTFDANNITIMACPNAA